MRTTSRNGMLSIEIATFVNINSYLNKVKLEQAMCGGTLLSLQSLYVQRNGTSELYGDETVHRPHQFACQWLKMITCHIYI